jgi:hypothetical protein
MVEESRLKGMVSGALNATFLALIPKSDKPDTFEGFRPISLCKLTYKIITKNIVARIKSSLSIGILRNNFDFWRVDKLQMPSEWHRKLCTV